MTTEKLPVLFLGHGSPMNAIEENEFSRGWQAIAATLPAVSAILCVSAHWETDGTLVTAMERPRTIHDFSGFPRELFEVEYPAPGSPALAAETGRVVRGTEVRSDMHWGLDHGCWSVMRHLFPGADVPVIQMSLDRRLAPQRHVELARELLPFRRKGVLIVGSGNIVHNLGLSDWRRREEGYPWAREADETVKKLVQEDRTDRLVDFRSLGREMVLAVPTPEHYLPLLYALAVKEEGESITFFNDRIVLGSISMTSMRIG
jgi:4,5-DOPA dioxygenase extradiol